MAWFKKAQYATIKGPKPIEIPSGLWTRCDGCRQLIYNKELASNLKVCPKCKHHFRLSAFEWLNLLLEEGSYQEYDVNIKPSDPLGFTDSKKYTDRLKGDQEKTKLSEAVITGEGLTGPFSLCVGVMDFSFRGGSMGSVVGEKITRLIEKAIKKKVPVVIVSTSGGARMQEGILSLMQMAKTSAAVGKLNKSGLPYISILTNPTTGGVAASFASLGDIIISEPQSVIGFAGARVIEQTIRQKLPSHFQKAEFLLQHGFVDMIVERRNIKGTIIKILEILK
jgi:acetyl-CoA carboxylase carboxyl transferase subunit beta